MKKRSPKKTAGTMHKTARFVVCYGTLAALFVLLCGFLPPRSSFLAISIGKTAVSMFALSVIGGLLIDVIAMRMGQRQ
ncbi:MAG: hypothetical protein IKW06_05745 [Clostridia bacterium]|nr:hypothetical protein [Clostridia bacterium]